MIASVFQACQGTALARLLPPGVVASVESVVEARRLVRPVEPLELADEVGGIVRTSSAVVPRHLRIGTEGAGTGRQGAARRDDHVRRLPLLDPPFERSQAVEAVRPWPAAAVQHARPHAEAGGVVPGLRNA